ncbi:hypothetical protein LS68_009145 [Helicobacter sp. MIT 05-5293]|uniref:hypothetical protein n=1 Tax=unclassified Helicobacter TaxID=2593540 RepID=UPI00051E13F5|nr:MULTISPECIES: hypothetical protein [unclassified Helicobacter]TLD79828.1 hypothetical protein LS68_009145 [Helicobacter sp. MIT 05-5293]TLD85539.1 hypothetical protein LS69_009110 [Helicobacter sp. MIT 05-5294]
MKNTEFEQKLESLGLSKKEFTAIVGMPYQTLMNWKQKGETPIWVDSWLENYKKAQNLDALLALIDKCKEH